MRFVQAKYYTETSGRDIRLQVLHTVEAPEKDGTAEAVARYFQNPPIKVSAHYCIDNDSEVQCVSDKNVAYTAPGANHDGLHYELAGYARQSEDEWRDKYSLAMLTRAAILVNKKCEQYGTPKTWLSDREVAALRDGICDHAAISRVYKKSTHTDTGPNFPKDMFIELVRSTPLLTQQKTPTWSLTIMNDCTAALVCPVDGGFQKLQGDGGVFNEGCTHYHGSYLENSMTPHRQGQPNLPFKEIVRIGDPDTSTKYAIVRQDGAVYGPDFE